MRKYIQFFRMSIINQLKYPVDLISGMLDKILTTFAMLFLWTAVYISGKQVGNFNVNEILVYITLANVIMFLFNNGKDRDMAKKMKSGDIAVDLIRPIQLQVYTVMRSLAESISKFCIFAILIVVFLKIVFPQYLFPDIYHCIAFLISVVLGICIQSEIDFCIGVLSFWFINYWGLSIAKEAVIKIFSGSLFPLELLGNFFLKIVNVLPFKYMVAIPIYIALGMHTEYIIKNILFQIMWVVVIHVIGIFLYRRAVKRIMIMGG